MSTVYLPVWAIVAGALALVALLYALQYLRAQPSTIKMASIQLWQEAVKQASPNTFWQRFRHWLAFVVAAIIVLLLWLAINGVTPSNDSDELHLYYLDTSVAMSISDNMAKAKAQLEADIPAASAANRTLWIGDAVPSALLDTDSPNALLKGILPQINASAHLSSFSDWLDTVALRAKEQPITVHYYGAQYDELNTPSGIRIVNAYLSPAINKNSGITAIGQQHYMTENQQAARVSFTLFDSEQSEFTTSDFTLRLNGKLVSPSQITTLNNNQFMYSGVPLTDQQQTLTVQLSSQDEFVADNSVSITLPARTQLFIAVQDGLPAWISRFVSANPLLTIKPSEAQVSLCVNNNDTCPHAKTTLYFNNDESQAAYFSPSPETRPNLHAIWQANNWQAGNNGLTMPELKINKADSTYARLPLKPLSTLIENQVPEPLLLLSSTLNWLANPQQTPPYLAVGESAPLLQGTSPKVASNIRAFPLTAEAEGETIATIQSPVTSSLVTHKQTTNEQPMVSSPQFFPWVSVGVLIALLLLIIEWILIQRGRWV